jgi:hypothetical protein
MAQPNPFQSLMRMTGNQTTKYKAPSGAPVQYRQPGAKGPTVPKSPYRKATYPQLFGPPAPQTYSGGQYFNGRYVPPTGPMTTGGLIYPTPKQTPRKVVLPPIMAGINTPGEPTAGGDGSGGYGGGGYGGYGGGGGGGYTNEPPAAPITWTEFDSGVANKPTWWKALKPSTMEPGTEYLASLNMMIPFLSPEDQKVVANTLYQQDAKNFGHLAPDKIGDVKYTATPNQFGEYGIAQADQTKFTSADRSQNALTALTKLAEATGKTAADLGPGFRYLQSLLSATKQYGGAGGEPQSRRQALEMLGAVDPILAQTQTGDLSAYGPLARMLANPFFSAGQLMPVQKTQDGTYVFGNPNKSFL